MSRVKGILLIMLAATCFGLIPLFTMISYDNRFNPFTFSLFRSGFAALEIYILLRITGINFHIERSLYPTLFKASLIGYCLMMVTLVAAFNYISTGLAMSLHFIYPIATMVGAMVVFWKKVFLKNVLALIISVLGIYLLVGFGSFDAFNLTGMFLALISGIFYAYYVLIAAYSPLKELNSFVLTFYVSLFNAIILFLGSLVSGNLFHVFNFAGVMSTVLVALFANLIGMVAFQAGLKIVGPTTATILSTFEPITSLIVGILILGELLAWYHIAGSLLILCSVVIVAITKNNSLDKDSVIGSKDH
ncbi:MAG: DMT family transporter [Dehalobacterium sp.]